MDFRSLLNGLSTDNPFSDKIKKRLTLSKTKMQSMNMNGGLAQDFEQSRIDLRIEQMSKVRKIFTNKDLIERLKLSFLRLAHNQEPLGTLDN